MRPPIFLFGLARKERQRRARWKKEKGAERDERMYEDQARHRDRRTWYSSGQNPEPGLKRVLCSVTKPAPVRGMLREQVNGCTRFVQCWTVAMTSFHPLTTSSALAPFSLWSLRTVSLFGQDRKEKWVLI